AAGTQVGYERAHELLHRTVLEDQHQQLALEASRHPAPVAPHRLETHHLELAADHARVALLAAAGAAPHLGHEEALVDLLELELEVALTAELRLDRRADAGRHLGPQRLA